jgi:hypothetical protein
LDPEFPTATERNFPTRVFAAAPAPPPNTVTVGADVYPAPEFATVKPVNTPTDVVAETVARFEKPPPSNST